MADVRTWVQGARPRTLPAAVVPVLVGTAVAAAEGVDGAGANLPRAALALVVSLALQVGVNYANDYSDGIRGTDTVRVGPVRLVGQGLASPRSVKLAAFGAFGVAALAGLVLAVLTTPWLIAVGLAAIAAAWGYTGGPRPYGYAGMVSCSCSCSSVSWPWWEPSSSNSSASRPSPGSPPFPSGCWPSRCWW